MSLQFLYPNWLWGLTLIALPIIIHLFNFRKFKLVYFTNVHLLESIKKETRSKSRIKEWLILLSRILFLIFLVLVFAQPVLVDENNKDLNATDFEVVVLLDNSFSMSSEGLSGIQIEFAKKKVLDILDAYPRQTSFMLVSSEARRKDLFFKSKDDVFTDLSQMKTSAFAQTLNQAYKSIQTILDSESKAERHFYILSDFQKKDFSPESFKQVLGRHFFISMPPAQQSNVYIDTAYFLSPLHSVFEEEQLVYRVHNTADKALPDFSVEYFINDTLKSISTLDLPSEGFVYDTIVYKNNSDGIKACELRINDLPVVFDNRLFFTYKIKERLQISVLSEGENNDYLEAFFKNNNFFDVKFYTPRSIDLAVWSQSDVMIVNQMNNWPKGLLERTEDLIEKGKSLVYFNSDKNILGELFGAKFEDSDTLWHQVSEINYASSLLKKAFVKKEKQLSLPHVFSKQYVKGAFNWLMKDKKNQTLVSEINQGLGSVLIFTPSMNEDNHAFYTHPVFIPLMYNFLTRAQEKAIYYEAGLSKTIQQDIVSDEKDQVLHIVSDDKDLIPEQYRNDGGIKYFLDSKMDAGHYSLIFETQKIDGISLNYQRKESISDFYTFEELSANTSIEWYEVEDFSSKSISEAIESIVALWIYALYFSLAFLIVEIFLIRWWRKA